MLVACLLAADVARDTSVTVDEFGYLPHGLAWLDPGATRLADGNPPQFKMLGALALRPGSYEWNTAWPSDAGDFWTLGATFMRANPAQYQALYDRARLVPIGALALTCLLTFVLATRLYGWKAGTFAVWLTALNPNMLAHGALLTPDIFFTAAIALSVLLAQLFWERPSSARAAGLGLAIGLTCLFKAAGLLLAVLLVATAFAQDRPVRPGSAAPLPWSHRRYRLIGILALAATIHVGYLFEGSLATFGTLTPHHPLFRLLTQETPWLPTVLPADFVTTLDFQLTDGGYPAYLDGRLNTTGFFDYYLRGLVYKTPPVALLLFVVAAVFGGRLKRSEMPLVLVALVMFTAFSLLRSKNIGFRYVLFFVPLMHVWISRLLAEGPEAVRAFGQRAAVALCTCGVAAAAASTALIAPHHLAYFNAPAGGPSAGPTHLLDSNVDWGQDLRLLKRFMDDRRIASIDLAYFGRVDPAVYGIDYRTLGAASERRWAAVSVNFIYGRGYFINGSQAWANVADYRRFQTLLPVSRLGHSLYVFDMGLDVFSDTRPSPP